MTAIPRCCGLRKFPPSHERSVEANFSVGVCRLRLSQPEKSRTSLLLRCRKDLRHNLVSGADLPEYSTNLALARARLGDVASGRRTGAQPQRATSIPMKTITLHPGIAGASPRTIWLRAIHFREAVPSRTGQSGRSRLSDLHPGENQKEVRGGRRARILAPCDSWDRRTAFLPVVKLDRRERKPPLQVRAGIKYQNWIRPRCGLNARAGLFAFTQCGSCAYDRHRLPLTSGSAG